MTKRNYENCAKEQQERLFSKELESLPEDERKAVLEDARQSAKEQQERLFLAQNDLRSKTMKEEEMKNRISLALKDPILQQGFEIICKENAELKADNDARKFAMVMSEKVEKQLREENAKSNVLFADIIEAFASCSYNDDFEMAQAGKEIYELFYGGKDPKEVFHNAEVPKCSRQLLVEAKRIIGRILTDSEVWQYKCCMTKELFSEAEQFLKE